MGKIGAAIGSAALGGVTGGIGSAIGGAIGLLNPFSWGSGKKRKKEQIEADGNGGNIYTQRKDGVIPEYNVRTDKWDMALETMDAYNKSKIARAEAYTLETESEQTNTPEGE